MKRRKSKAPLAKWYKSCRKQLPKSNCDQLMAIAKRRSTHVRFAGAPDFHARAADSSTGVAQEYEALAHAAFARNDCKAAYENGLRAVAASTSALDHARESNIPTVIQRAQTISRTTGTLMFKQLPKCLKKSPSF